MGQIFHVCATAAETVCRALQYGQASLRALARRYGITSKSAKLGKWSSVADLSSSVSRRTIIVTGVGGLAFESGLTLTGGACASPIIRSLPTQGINSAIHTQGTDLQSEKRAGQNFTSVKFVEFLDKLLTLILKHDAYVDLEELESIFNIRLSLSYDQGPNRRGGHWGTHETVMAQWSLHPKNLTGEKHVENVSDVMISWQESTFIGFDANIADGLVGTRLEVAGWKSTNPGPHAPVGERLYYKTRPLKLPSVVLRAKWLGIKITGIGPAKPESP